MDIELYEKIENTKRMIQTNIVALNNLNDILENQYYSNTEYITDNFIKQYDITSRVVSEAYSVSQMLLNSFTLNENQKTYLNNTDNELTDKLNINIKVEDYKLIIGCPKINLHRKNIKSQPYFLGCLEKQLNDFKETDDFKNWVKNNQKEEMAILFLHESAIPEKCIDNDNLDVKNIIDLFDMLGFIKSDRGDKLLHIHKGEVTNRFYTTITLFPMDKVNILL